MHTPTLDISCEDQPGQGGRKKEKRTTRCMDSATVLMVTPLEGPKDQIGGQIFMEKNYVASKSQDSWPSSTQPTVLGYSQMKIFRQKASSLILSLSI